VVEVDGEWIRFCGRETDIINVGGEKVTPSEVEQSILELGFVREVVVSGKPHALMGNVVIAQVALSSGALSAKEAIKLIRSHCQQRLASHKVPVEIEITTSMLVNERQKLRRQHSEK
jgi:acyl-coenzyme A synthetase/AMP-(fatty) acid ligase